MRIVVLDHEPSEADIVCGALTAAGHVCQAFQHGKEMLAQLRKDSYDLLILDCQADADVLRRARDKLAAGTPVLLLAESSHQDQIIAGMAGGADDYLLKPLRCNELVARVQVLLRRSYPDLHGAELFRFGQYLFETRPGQERPGQERPGQERLGQEASGRLIMDGMALELTHKEFCLALLFFRNLGRPLSRAYIHEAVWMHDTTLPSRTLDTHVSRVRNKLLLKPEHGFRLAPVYSYGYRLEKLET
jgi:DNA-binding response OmpR family regulator